MKERRAENKRALESIAQSYNLSAEQCIKALDIARGKVRCSESVLIQQIEKTLQSGPWQGNHFQLLCSEFIPLKDAELDHLLNTLSNAMNASENPS